MKKSLLFCLSILCSLQFSGQVIFNDLVSSSGDCYESPTILCTWSLGEFMTENLVDNSIMLSQGFHQPLMFEREAKPHPRYEDLEISVHPNPATNYIELIISEEFEPLDGCFIEIYDLAGNCLMKQPLLSHHVTINISRFNRRTLILRLTLNQFILKSLTIQRIY